MSEFLRVTIPEGQQQAHVVRLTGDFDGGYGVEFHSFAGGNTPIERTAELTINNENFIFRSLYLNTVGHIIIIKFGANTNYQVVEASSVTKFERFSAIVEGNQSLID